MYRWWDKHRLQTILVVIGLSTTYSIRQTQGSAIAEAYYFLVRPFQSQKQLILEDKLTNARILELEQQVTELTQQNRQLKQLLNLNKSQTDEGISAPIIGRSADRWWHQITLGKGSKDGIEKGFIVMGIGGVVGRVINVTPHTSQVLLISDGVSRVGATLSRNRHMGYIQGKNSQTVVMHFFSNTASVQPGDEIVISSLSNLYPSGLPLGKVKSVKPKSGFAPEAEVELSAPIEILEWVTVQPFKPKI